MHVDMAALDDGPAVLALLIEVERRVRSGLVVIVEGAGQDTGGRGLADAAHAGQDEGMVDAAAAKALVRVRTMAS